MSKQLADDNRLKASGGPEATQTTADVAAAAEELSYDINNLNTDSPIFYQVLKDASYNSPPIFLNLSNTYYSMTMRIRRI